MPRASFVGSDSFRAGEQDHSPENQNFDFCRRCWRSLTLDDFVAEFVSPWMNGEALDPKWISFDKPDGDEHPPYDCDSYICQKCGVDLITSDD